MRFFRENGLFRALFVLGGMYPRKILKICDWKLCIYKQYNMTTSNSKLCLTKHVQNCKPFWTFWDHGGILSYPLQICHYRPFLENLDTFFRLFSVTLIFHYHIFYIHKENEILPRYFLFWFHCTVCDIIFLICFH